MTLKSRPPWAANPDLCGAPTLALLETYREYFLLARA
jgi:hypothetical protein